MNEILCFSGGVDSYIAWLKLGKPRCIHFTKHSRYSDRELRAVNLLEGIHPEMRLIVIELPWLKAFEAEDAHIPLRNVYFVEIASHYGDIIYLPCQLGEREIPNRSDKFFTYMSEFLTWQHGKPKQVNPVFENETKADLIGWYLGQYYPIENLKLTYSCFLGLPKRCGVCAACFRLALALIYNDIDYIDWFAYDPIQWSGVDEYIKKFKQGFYESRRAMQSLEALRKVGRI